MLNRSKLLIAAFAATALLGALVSSASANVLSTNETGFRITWIELELTETVFGIGVHCPVTLEGRFHSNTISKVERALIGFVTEAVVNNERCRGGRATVLRETLPWHVRYAGFTGILPRITGIITTLSEPAFRIETFFITCLSRAASIKGTIRGSIEGGGAFKPETLVPGTETIPCRSAGGGSINGVFSGTGTVTKQNSEERILIRLI